MVDEIEKLILCSFLSWRNILSFILQGPGLFWHWFQWNHKCQNRLGPCGIYFILYWIPVDYRIDKWKFVIVRYPLSGHLNVKARKLIHVYSGFNSFFIVSSPRKLHQRKFRLLKNHGWLGSQNSPSRENENTPCKSALL